MLWIKICGLTTADAVKAAIDAGANAVGFVFAPSKRQVTIEQALALARDVPKHVARVAVMQHPSQQLLDEVCRSFAPDVLQTDASDLLTLQVPDALQVMPVMRDGQSGAAPLPARILFEGKTSGAGVTADWTQARGLAAQTELVLAGGLNEHNVAEAIALVQPFGVDVSSGVESAPGVKDPMKIASFVRAARRAANAR